MDLSIQLTYEWIPVWQIEGVEYVFPNSITSFMRQRYRGPAVYRWNYHKIGEEDSPLYYIGETQQFCPDRINGYLNPGPTQETNKRLNAIFRVGVERGDRLRLDILQLSSLRIGNDVLTHESLYDKHVRRFIEEVLTVLHKQQGFRLLNI